MAYINAKKGFGKIDRKMLLYKAMINGLGGKMYNALTNIYTGSYSAVNLSGHVTDWFECNEGVRQGDTLSPTFFGLMLTI